MDVGKWLWRGVLATVTVVAVVAGYRLGGDVLRSQVPAAPVLATVTLLDGSALELDQVVVDQDLITISSSQRDLQMSWDGAPAQSRLVIDPAQLPEAIRAKALYKWLVPVPKDAVETDGNSAVPAEKRLCLSLKSQQTAECYRFSRLPKQAAQQAVCGNGVVEDGEACDDGNQIDTDDCSNSCHWIQSAATPLSYPRPRLSVQAFSNDVLTFFVTLEPFKDTAQNQANPADLFMRLKAEGDPEVLSQDRDRVNGYPFLQAILGKGTAISLDFIQRINGRDLVYDHQTIADLEAGAELLKGSAPSPLILTTPSLDALSFSWQGTDKTAVDLRARVATDQSDSGHDFSTKVLVNSLLKDNAKVVVKLVDDSVAFTHAVAAGGHDEVLVNVQRLAYGSHRLLINAVFSNGQKSADVVIPFEYRSSGLLNLSGGKSLFQYWQWGAVGFLVFFGLLYAWLKLLVFRKRTEMA